MREGGCFLFLLNFYACVFISQRRAFLRHEKAVHIGVFKLQPPDFLIYTTRLSRKASARSNDSVAWNDNRYLIMSDSASDRLRGHFFKSHLFCKPF